MSAAAPAPDPHSSSNAPNAFYRQHHQVEAPEVSDRAFRPGWRVRTQLDRLLLDGQITGFEWRIAGWLRSCAERTAGGDLRSPMTALGMPGRSRYGRRRDGPTPRQLQARAHLRHVERTLGPVVYSIVIAVVVEDLPWCALGKHYGVHAKTARRWAIEAIKVLATV
jgi:hypothetical protein